MAISGGDGSIILTTKVDESGLKKGFGSMGKTAKSFGVGVAKSFAVIGAAAATATVAITKMAVSAYADYEQLVGGVETLFKGSADKVMKYAENAFYTSGVSANEYMKRVTSFSASLIRSTAGDTDKAADIANMALIDISDNVNKMGSSMESVTLAYQGFAKQQYMLLDNLKLGYGGTKTEMERLLRDAEALTGVKYDISNLADVYSAIHAIQEQLGITGTTAKEAEKTISGSANMMKASWQNVLTAIAGGGDLDKAINNLVYSIQKYFENIVPVVERSLQGIGQLIERVAPMLVQTVARSLIKAIPSLLNAVYQMIIGLAKGIYQGIIDLFKGGTQKVLEAQTNEIAQSVENQNALTEAIEETNKEQKKSLAGFDEINTLSKDTAENQELLGGVGSNGGANTPLNIETEETEKELSAFEKAFKNVFDDISKIIKKAWDSEPVQAFWKACKSYGGFLWNYWSTLGTDLWQNLKTTWGNIEKDFATMSTNLSNLWTNVWNDFNNTVLKWGEPITNSVSNLFNSIWSTAIDPAVQFIAGMWTDFTGILNNIWNEHGGTLLDNIGEFSNNIIGLFQSIYDNVLEPIIKPFLETLSWLWDEHISKLVEKVGNFVMKLVNGALEIYNKVIQPILVWLLEKLAPAWSFIGNLVIGVFGSIIAVVSDVVGAIIDFLGGIIDFIVGVFTGNWKKAWQGLKDAFKGIIDGIVAIFKFPINLIIDAINAFIGGLNKIKIPDWVPAVGGKGLNIPKIPKLAQGAVIPPNREFVAVLGDNKNGRNLEAPESLIRQIVREETQGLGNNGNIVIEASGTMSEFIRMLNFKLKQENDRASVF